MRRRPDDAAEPAEHATEERLAAGVARGWLVATHSICGLSQLAVWWIKHDIDHQRIDPGCPQQNGAQEHLRP